MPRVRRRPPGPAGVACALVVAVLVVGACAPPVPATTSPPGTALRVMTWNVQTRERGPRDWADAVARLRPDVLALQEICAGEADELAAILTRERGLAYRSFPGPIRPPTPAEARAPVNAALGPVCGTGPDDVAYGLAVLTRLPAGAPTVTTYPPDPRDEQRGFMTVRVTPAAGTPVTVVDTHLGLDGVQADQVGRLADGVARAGPAVVLGDLNLGARDPRLDPLRVGFAEIDPDGRYPTTWFGAIDHVFLRGLTPTGPPLAPETSASDHRPLVADLRVDG